MATRVLVTDGSSEGDDRHEVIAPLVEEHGGELVYGDFETEAEVIEGCRDANVVLTSKAPMTRAVIEHIEEPAYIFRTADGCDTINIKAATERGIPLLHVPGYYLADVVAEHAIGLMLAAAREMAYCDREMREQNGWGLGKGRRLQPMHGGTFGVVGLGEIGRAAADRAKGLGMDVVAYDPYLPQDLFERLEVEAVGFPELLSRADCVSVHTPLTAETHGMFGAEAFAAMKETAVFVNGARGPIVDVEALVEAVESGEIFAAGLDNFEVEPPVDSPAFDCDRVLCSPHHAAAGPDLGQVVTDVVEAELGRVLRGEHPRHVYNQEVLLRSDRLLNPERDDWQVETE